MSVKKLLILGGTGDAALLAKRAVDFWGPDLDIIVSYAGVTGHQPDLPCQLRVGGFGGVEGLVSYLEEEGITHMVDATHPFAEKMSQHAFIAANKLKLPLVVLWREPWMPAPKDKWLEVGNMKEAVEQVERLGSKTFLTIGIKELSAFAELDEVDFVIRLVSEPKEELAFKKYETVIGRPPFSVEEERQLIRDKNIRLLVTKNSGGTATKAKIEAAREENVAVIMINRPPQEPLEYLSSPAQVLEWLRTHGL
ncbi:Precorrin-6A reductase [Candidatus Terasakiella magnetica]|uniref:Precorrin-6A reductase n=1 Tax=Candidatus Terasakiella magnetica TaxID=1867952 RepID=A0A1C3RLP1_9PROT|nr:cobalt-precorrin-6A reductase [Candidatus Terasakiella magnetica]SCA58204.1 Precorrin-6A reductase [Candidatus Terasakiella magnetica]